MAIMSRFYKLQRTGSIYITVLASSMIVMTLGLGSLLAVRVQRRSTQITCDYVEACNLSRSAIELGLFYVSNDPNWRYTWSNGVWISNQPLGRGSYSLEGIDPQDDDLANSKYNPLLLRGTGIRGTTRHKSEVTLAPVIKPLEALNTCLHASGRLKVNGGKIITAFGAPVSTNGQLDNDGTIDGDADANSIDDIGTITGNLTLPAASKQMPDPNVISDYIARATVIPFTGDIEKQVLTASYNPWGPVNPDGIYFIDTADHDLDIKYTRIHGTLIVRLGTKKLTLDKSIFMKNYRSDCPVLIVDGEAEIKYESRDYGLSEVSTSTNYNPFGAPYEGQWDSDIQDEYPNEIQGLVHVRGFLKLKDTALIKGAVICEGSVECDEKNTIIHDSGLYACPPEGYTFVDHMQISPGSWKQVVE